MTQGPEEERPHGQPPYGQPPYGQPPQGRPPYGQQPPAGHPVPQAPFGVHPVSGIPYSEKSKLVAGLLQILVPLGIGRFYMGDSQTGVWQLVVTVLTCGVGAIWPFIDGILLLVGDPVDEHGRPLRG